MKTLFICLITLAALTTTFLEHPKGMAEKYCPMRGLNGESYCPKIRKTPLKTPLEKYMAKLVKDDPLLSNKKSDIVTPEFTISNRLSKVSELVDDVMDEYETKLPDMSYDKKSDAKITSGFGFDRVTREMKFPLFATQNLVKNVQVEDDARVFSSANHFIDYSLNRQKKQEGGLYVRDLAAIGRIAESFVDSSSKMAITQRKFRTHTSSLSGRALPEFLGAVKLLPPYNAGNGGVVEQYRNIIQWWGTDYAVNVKHGGTIYQQTTIRECYGGNLGPQIIDELNSAIENKPPPGSGYLKYRKLGVFEVRGGNPNFGQNRLKERINSFSSAPAPIEWETAPIWQAISDRNRRTWMEQAVLQYIADHNGKPRQLKAEIANRRLAQYRSRRRLHLVRKTLEHWGNIIIRWNECPFARYRGGVYAPGCTVRRDDILLGAGQSISIGGAFSGADCIVERNAQGHVRIIMKHGDNIERSEWTDNGCVSVKQFGRSCGRRHCIDWNRVLRRTVCLDVMPAIRQIPGRYNQQQTLLNPVCPTY